MEYNYVKNNSNINKHLNVYCFSNVLYDTLIQHTFWLCWKKITCMYIHIYTHCTKVINNTKVINK